MNLEKHINLFNRISVPYNWFFKSQVRWYDSILKKHRGAILAGEREEILDIGCGTGAWTASLLNYNFSVIGLDYSHGMLKTGGKKNLSCIRANALRLPFKDNSFKTVTMSYVLHGLNSELRHNLYSELKRVCSHQLIIQDYLQKRRLFTDIIEWFEGGDYFNFIKDIDKELRDSFGNLEIIPVDSFTGWYICQV